ncbi:MULTISPECIES: N-acetyltransferase [Actinoplanes]|uniref:N-acetyltransferase n=1 Tax=Actinoplanes TaxID=1865 RepID=UPI0005F286A2|nr:MULTISPECIES: N-acetyltransferase [Actinoplanes]
MELTVTEAPERERFEARDSAGEVVGVLTYQLTGPIVVFTHTSPSPGADAAAVTAALARAAMEDAKAKGRTVVPMCPLFSAWLDKNPAFEKLVARSTRRVR